MKMMVLLKHLYYVHHSDATLMGITTKSVFRCKESLCFSFHLPLGSRGSEIPTHQKQKNKGWTLKLIHLNRKLPFYVHSHFLAG